MSISKIVFPFWGFGKGLSMEGFKMEMFRTLDIRGLSFFKSLQLATDEFRKIKKNGILELIVDKKKNFKEDFSKWAKKQGFKISGIEDDPRIVRLFIRKGSRAVKA
jgi:TusA-related sulfurtransferase